MLTRQVLEKAIYELVKRLPYTIAGDMKGSLRWAQEVEESEVAKMHLRVLMEHLSISEHLGISTCGDTGFPSFFIKVGDLGQDLKLWELEEVITKAVLKATEEFNLRPSLTDPFFKAPPSNVGGFIPSIDYLFDPSSQHVEITGALFGGGAEIGGTTFRTLLQADGLQGMKKFVIDSVIEACKTGLTCPPNVIGIGRGGPSTLCLKLSKYAAFFRPIGVRHPLPDIAKLEEELLEAINSTGIGSLGMGGSVTALDVHIEYTLGHLAGAHVGVTMQCPAARHLTLKLYRDGSYEYAERPDWKKWLRWERYEGASP